MEKLRALAVTVCCALAIACQSWQPPTRPFPLTDGGVFKSSIQVQTADGNKWTLTNAHVQGGLLIGTIGKAEVNIPVGDVIQVKVMRYDGKKTWATIGFIGDVLGGVADAMPSGKH